MQPATPSSMLSSPQAVISPDAFSYQILQVHVWKVSRERKQDGVSSASNKSQVSSCSAWHTAGFPGRRLTRWRFFCSSLMSLSFFLRSVSVASNARGLSGWLSEPNLAMLDLARGLSSFVAVLAGSVTAESGGTPVAFPKLFSSSAPRRLGDPVLLEPDRVERLCGDPDIKDALVLVWIWLDMLALWILDCLDSDNRCRVAIVTYLCLAATALKYASSPCTSRSVYRIRYTVISFILIQVLWAFVSMHLELLQYRIQALCISIGFGKSIQ